MDLLSLDSFLGLCLMWLTLSQPSQILEHTQNPVQNYCAVLNHGVVAPWLNSTWNKCRSYNTYFWFLIATFPLRNILSCTVISDLNVNQHCGRGEITIKNIWRFIVFVSPVCAFACTGHHEPSADVLRRADFRFRFVHGTDGGGDATHPGVSWQNYPLYHPSTIIWSVCSDGQVRRMHAFTHTQASRYTHIHFFGDGNHVILTYSQLHGQQDHEIYTHAHACTPMHADTNTEAALHQLNANYELYFDGYIQYARNGFAMLIP